MKKKLPKHLALLLAELHNKVMEAQETFDTFKRDLYCGDFNQEEVGLEDFDLEELESEVEYICDQLDTIEAETSELDCEYNDYEYEVSSEDLEDLEESEEEE